MKTIYEHAIGGDGAVGGLYVDNGFVVEQVKYPVAKFMAPVLAPLDALEKKLEAIAPDVLDPMIKKAFDELKAAITSIIGA